MTMNAKIFLVMTLLACLPAHAALDGPALYQENCAKCHGVSGAADSFRGYLYFARNFTSGDWQRAKSDAYILDKINSGPRIMPSFEDSLSGEEKQALIQVVRNFKAKP